MRAKLLLNLRKNSLLLKVPARWDYKEMEMGKVKPPPTDPNELMAYSLEETIEYYSQAEGDEGKLFNELNIAEEPTEAILTNGGSISGVDGRFVKGIPNEGNTCFFNAALQLLLCNEDFLQLMIQGNCEYKTRDDFVNSLNKKSLVVKSGIYTKEICKNDNEKHEKAKKIISNLLWFFNKWKKGEQFSKKDDKPDENKGTNPIALLVDELSDKPIGNTADATEVLGNLFGKIDCVDNAFIQKFLQNLNIEVEETLTTPAIESVAETNSKQIKPVSFNPITIDATDSVEKMNNKEYNLSDLINNLINEKNNPKIYSLNDQQISNFASRKNLISILNNLNQELTILNSCAGAYYGLTNANHVDKASAETRYNKLISDLNTKPGLTISALETLNESDYSSFFTGYDSKPTPYPDKWKYKSIPQEAQDKRNIPASLVKNIIQKTNELTLLMTSVNFNDDGAKKKFISDNAESIKTLNMLIGDVMYVIRSPLQTDGKPYESTTSKKALKCGKYLASYINRTYKNEYGSDGKYEFKIKIEPKIVLNVNGTNTNFTLLGFIVHIPGHYFYVKCDNNGNVCAELNDSQTLVPKSIDNYYNGITGFIYKRADELGQAGGGFKPRHNATATHTTSTSKSRHNSSFKVSSSKTKGKSHNRSHTQRVK